MESKLRFGPESWTPSAGTTGTTRVVATGTTRVVAIVPFRSHCFLNYLVSMGAMVGFLLMFAVGETN